MHALFMSLIAALNAVAAPSFAGNWLLDRSASQNLPPFYSEVKSHRLAVSQTETQLDVRVAVDIGGPSPDTLAFVYRLDGTQTTATTQIRMQDGPHAVPVKLTASRTANGVHILIDREITMGDQVIKGLTEEDWTLASDGKTLTVVRQDQTPNGLMKATMVFRKE